MVALSSAGEARSAAPGPVVWVLHDGKPGMRSQALGLAEAAGLRFDEIALSVRRPWAWLPPQLWVAPLVAATDAGRRLLPPWPDLVIGCGRNAVRPALAIRRASSGRTLTAHIQDPRFGRGDFDLLFVPEHDHLRRFIVGVVPPPVKLARTRMSPSVWCPPKLPPAIGPMLLS